MSFDGPEEEQSEEQPEEQPKEQDPRLSICLGVLEVLQAVVYTLEKVLEHLNADSTPDKNKDGAAEA